MGNVNCRLISLPLTACGAASQKRGSSFPPQGICSLLLLTMLQLKAYKLTDREIMQILCTFNTILYRSLCFLQFYTISWNGGIFCLNLYLPRKKVCACVCVCVYIHPYEHKGIVVQKLKIQDP